MCSSEWPVLEINNRTYINICIIYITWIIVIRKESKVVGLFDYVSEQYPKIPQLHGAHTQVPRNQIAGTNEWLRELESRSVGVRERWKNRKREWGGQRKKWTLNLLQFNKYNMKMSVNAIVFDVSLLINLRDLLYFGWCFISFTIIRDG